MNIKNDKRTLCEIPDSELEDLLYDYAVTQHGHASVKSYCNDLSLWGDTVDHALSLYGNKIITTHTPGPGLTRLQDCALYDHAARRVQWRIWPITNNKMAAAQKFERMRQIRITIQRNLRSDCHQ